MQRAAFANREFFRHRGLYLSHSWFLEHPQTDTILPTVIALIVISG
jgi:hypothetical protein